MHWKGVFLIPLHVLQTFFGFFFLLVSFSEAVHDWDHVSFCMDERAGKYLLPMILPVEVWWVVSQVAGRRLDFI